MNDNKTKVTKLLPTGNVVIQEHIFEKVHPFTFLGAIISDNNDWSIESKSESNRNSRIIKAEKASFLLTKYRKFKLFSRRINMQLYAPINRLTLT